MLGFFPHAPSHTHTHTHTGLMREKEEEPRASVSKSSRLSRPIPPPGGSERERERNNGGRTPIRACTLFQPFSRISREESLRARPSDYDLLSSSSLRVNSVRSVERPSDGDPETLGIPFTVLSLGRFAIECLCVLHLTWRAYVLIVCILRRYKLRYNSQTRINKISTRPLPIFLFLLASVYTFPAFAAIGSIPRLIIPMGRKAASSTFSERGNVIDAKFHFAVFRSSRQCDRLCEIYRVSVYQTEHDIALSFSFRAPLSPSLFFILRHLRETIRLHKRGDARCYQDAIKMRESVREHGQ